MLSSHGRPPQGRGCYGIDAVVANFRHIIAVNRNLGFFTVGYADPDPPGPDRRAAVHRGERSSLITQSASRSPSCWAPSHGDRVAIPVDLLVRRRRGAAPGALAEGIEQAQAVTVLSTGTHGHVAVA